MILIFAFGTKSLSLIVAEIQGWDRQTHKHTFEIQNRPHPYGMGRLKIIQWNKGGETLQYKMEDIKEIIVKHKPMILIVNELNLEYSDHQSVFKIDGFNFECDKLIENNKTGRTGMWIDKRLVYTRIKDLNIDQESIVAIRAGFPNKRKINVIDFNFYFFLGIAQQNISLENVMVKINIFF